MSMMIHALLPGSDRRRFVSVGLAVVVVSGLIAACSTGSGAGGGSRTNGGFTSDAPGTGGSAALPDASAIRLVFPYGSEKQAWLAEATSSFNAQRERIGDGRVIQVDAQPMGSGELVDAVLSGEMEAHVISPASGAFVTLGNAQSRTRTGADLVDRTDSLVVSPVVVAMWRPMAEALGWGERPVGWSDIIALANDPEGWATHGFPQWGRFRFGHTHPEYSNSGLISLLAEVYAGAGKVAGLSRADVARPEVAAFLGQIEQAVVHYGSSTGFFAQQLVANGPEYLSAAVLYENNVIESYDPAKPKSAFPLVAIYPKEGTFWADHPVGIVQRPWVTDAHREAAAAYIAYLMARPQQEQALRYGFRPADVAIPLGAPIDAAHGVDPAQPSTTLEVPSADVLQAVIDLWHENKKRADVTVVFDTSGSMGKSDKLANARDGLRQLVALLDDRDRLSLLTFNDRPAWAIEDAELGDKREAVATLLDGLFAEGDTALYDAIDAARQRIDRAPPAGRIAAIVVLSDGEDTASEATLDALLADLRRGSEGQSVRIFTIGYGDDAKGDVLKAIADATKAKFFAGTPDNIQAVFREIATFF